MSTRRAGVSSRTHNTHKLKNFTAESFLRDRYRSCKHAGDCKRTKPLKKESKSEHRQKPTPKGPHSHKHSRHHKHGCKTVQPRQAWEVEKEKKSCRLECTRERDSLSRSRGNHRSRSGVPHIHHHHTPQQHVTKIIRQRVEVPVEVPVVKDRVLVREVHVPVVRERIRVKEVPVVKERVIIKQVPVYRDRIHIKEVPVVKERVVVQRVEVPVVRETRRAVDRLVFVENQERPLQHEEELKQHLHYHACPVGPSRMRSRVLVESMREAGYAGNYNIRTGTEEYYGSACTEALQQPSTRYYH